MHKLNTLISVFIIFISSLSAQSVVDLNTDGELSLRGLSVVDNKVVWVSGNKGKVGRSVDGGKTWKWISVKGFEKSEFRDIEAFSESTAIIMSVAEPAFILKTVNGGKSWKKVYENKTKGMFLDAMDFADMKKGVVVGDPVGNRFFIASTSDGGTSWNNDSQQLNFPVPDSAEACFASSGTNIRMINKDQFVFVTGGINSNIIVGNQKIKLPLLQGKASTGANSVAIKDSLTFIVAGGDFTEGDSIKGNCAITFDGGKSWSFPQVPPHGYRSCVEYISGDTWICCGLNGVDISEDNGKTWRSLSTGSYHACRKAKNGKSIFFSGNQSRIGRLSE